MAERLDMEYLTLWRKLSGKRSMDVSLLKRIAEILGTSVAYLLGETDDPSLHLSKKSVSAKKSKLSSSSSKIKKTHKKISNTTIELENMFKDILYEYPDLAAGFKDTQKQWSKMSQNRKNRIVKGLIEVFIPKS